MNPSTLYSPFGSLSHDFAKPTLITGNKNYSSWSLRAWLMLHGFGVDFEEMPILLFHSSNQAVLQAYTPLGKVPVLLHDHKTIWDSLGIALYAQQKLIAQNVWGNQPAIAMSLVAEMHSGFLALRQEMPMNIRARCRVEPSDACLADIERFEAIVASSLSHGFSQSFAHGQQDTGYLLGAFSIADVFFAPVVFRLKTYAEASGVVLTAATQDYLATMLAHPSVQQWQQAALAETAIIPDDEAGEPLL